MKKNKTIALILCIFLGYLGVHRFYLGKTKTGVLYLFTGGLCGIGWIVDTILIIKGKFTTSYDSTLTRNNYFPNNTIIAHQQNNSGIDFSSNFSTNVAGGVLSDKPCSVYSSEKGSTEHFAFKVAGVTFKNGRKERQAILRKIKWHDEPFDGSVYYTLKQYDFEGETAVGIYANDEQIGNVPREHLAFVLENWNRISAVSSVIIYGGNKKDDGTHTNFGAEVTLSLTTSDSVNANHNISNGESYVYISAHGKKYHNCSCCGGMKDSTRIGLYTAKSQGYYPCEKCC